MNAVEAQRVLRENHYCLKHLIAMIDHGTELGAHWLCPDCVRENGAKLRKDIEESIAILKGNK